MFLFCDWIVLSEQKDTVSSSSSSNEEEHGNSRLQKKNSPQGKKPKERTSPVTSENEGKICMDESSDLKNISRKDDLDLTGKVC